MAGIPIVGPGLGAAAAAAAVLAGIANVKKILSVNTDGSGAGISGGATVSSSAAAVIPNINISEALPMQYTRNLLGDTEMDELNKSQKVYVLESDITDTQNKVAVTENNSSF